MQARHLFYLTIILLLGFSFNACEDKEDDKKKGNNNQEATNEYVNSWVFDEMDVWYYWRDKMPSERTLDFSIDPNLFFEKIIYSDDNYPNRGEDRFSWIQPSYVDLMNSLTGVSSNEIGFEYIPVGFQNTNDIVFRVLYLKKGTNAEKSGLKRGDIITKVDGVSLNRSNWSAALYQNKSSYTLEGNFSGKIVVEPTAKYYESPIYINKTFEIDGKKIGYIMYNQFTMDNGDGSYKYDKELASIFSDYDSKGVNNLVLDLRYNGGGYTSCAVNIASALVPDRDTENIFYYSEYNSVIDAVARKQFNEEEYDQFINVYYRNIIERVNDNGSVTNMGSIPNYGDKLEKLYILVGGNTASASELVINGLIPFMKNKMVLIGETTYGKNVGSITITDDENLDNNKWGIQPIVFKSFNQDDKSEYGSGFTPGVQLTGYQVIDPIAYLDDPMEELGNENEPLLAYALADITGQSKPRYKSLPAPDFNIIGSSFELKSNAYQMYMDKNKVQKLIKSQLVK